jgi:pimeloyl-ACP methyl ester carboxylesterase
VWGALKTLSVPTTFVRGRESATFSRAAMKRVKKTATTLETAGGHLFPLEHPVECDGLIRP